MSPSDVDFPIGLDIAGVAVGAVQGAVFGHRRTRVSVVGVAVLALVTALGGAMIRDALMAVPSAALSTPYLVTWAVATAIGIGLAYYEHRVTTALIVLDAAYLGIWTVAGADKADHLQYGLPAVVLLGVITGIGGGLLRDVLAGQPPTLFLGGPLYTVAALGGSILFTGLHETALPRPVSAAVAVGLIFALRLLALRYRWFIPIAGDMPHPSSWLRRPR